MRMSDYWALPGFDQIYLEDSWVLGVTAAPGTVTFDLEVVLREGHPDYVAPGPNQNYCYRRASIRFGGVTALSWTEQGRPPATDSSREIDFGSIDTLTVAEEGHVVEGDFGRMLIRAGLPTIEWEPYD
jgi:hypothetical protein